MLPEILAVVFGILFVIAAGLAVAAWFLSGSRGKREGQAEVEEKYRQLGKDADRIISDAEKAGAARSRELINEAKAEINSLKQANEKEISGGRLKDVWHSKYQNYTDISGYKIGYHLKFETVDGVVEQTILKPSDGDYVYKYIQVYLYDDVNQEASFYSHIEDKDMTENTMLTTIKLFTSTKIADVISPIELTVFTYNGEEDFKDGMYRGNSKFTTIIKKK